MIDLLVVPQLLRERMEAQRKRLDEEAAFYKRDPNKLPPALKRQVEDNALQAAAHKRSLAGIDEERKRINLRFDDELDQLWSVESGLAGDGQDETFAADMERPESQLAVAGCIG